MRTGAIVITLLVAGGAAAGETVAPGEPAENGVLAAFGAPAARAAGPLPAIGTVVVVRLADGQALRGRFTGWAGGALLIEVGGVRIPVPEAAVRGVERAGGPPAAEAPPPRDPNRTRYLYSPSAFTLRRGEGYVSQTELALTTVAVGATDWLTLQAGTILPIAFYDPTMLPVAVAAKAGWSPAPRWHLAGGFQALAVRGDAETVAAGFLFGTVTWGTEDLHVGLSVGPPFLRARGEAELGRVLASLSLNWRAFRSGALVTENWLLTGGGETHLLASGAYRFISGRIAVDVGLVFSDLTGVPVPWLDFTWHWG